MNRDKWENKWNDIVVAYESILGDESKECGIACNCFDGCDIAIPEAGVRQCIALSKENARLRDALAQIAKGEGPYSTDPLTHADNCIESMKKIASDALSGIYQSEDY